MVARTRGDRWSSIPPAHVAIDGLVHHDDSGAVWDAGGEGWALEFSPGDVAVEEGDVGSGRYVFAHVSATMGAIGGQAADDVDKFIGTERKNDVHKDFSRYGVRIGEFANELASSGKVG